MDDGNRRNAWISGWKRAASWWMVLLGRAQGDALAPVQAGLLRTAWMRLGVGWATRSTGSWMRRTMEVTAGGNRLYSLCDLNSPCDLNSLCDPTAASAPSRRSLAGSHP